MTDAIQVLGVTGMLLVFASFTIKSWIWLYSLNLLGTLLLDAYAILRGDIVFTILETGIAIFLLYRLTNEFNSKRQTDDHGNDVSCTTIYNEDCS